MFKNKMIVLTLIIVIVSNLMCGCSLKLNSQTVNAILDESKSKAIERNLSVYENKDGGFFYYKNSEESLYYTYHCLNIINRYEGLDSKLQQNTQKWINDVESYYLTNNDVFLVLNNIFYYLSIAKMVNYNMSESEYNTIIEVVDTLYDERGFYLKPKTDIDDSNDFSASKILANKRGIQIFTLLNKDIPNREYIENWCYRLIDKTCDSKIDRIGNINSAISILNMLGLTPSQQKIKIRECFDEYVIPDDIPFLDLYSLFVVESYLKDQEDVSPDSINYVDIIKLYKSKDGNIFDKKSDGNVLFIDLAMEMSFKLDESITWDNTIEMIKKMQLSNGSFSNSFEINSDMNDTFYAYKCFVILGLGSEHSESLIRYLLTAENYYDDLDDYEKILYLDMKYDLGISNNNDFERVNDIIQMAYSYDVGKNYFLMNNLLTICKKYKIEINSDYRLKIEAFINDKVARKYDSIEESISMKIFAYEFATKIENANSDILESEIVSEFQMNYDNYENLETLAFMMMESTIQLEDEEIRNLLRDNNAKKIDYSIVHNSLYLNEEGDNGFYSMYITLFILYKVGLSTVI
ncbi:hypothetical protein [Fusibacter sp. 3D3]|uniref:prenyltransferase/squalene oxidase repeat-containing protein n=1 Tax=Fusibacter sp. 3D3 TaxID=1048380 RepID=UPI0008537823|nr:hypothetical protein [Fusibacter sp. 3D3]GAU78237.1 hypothetical protein F3D3_2869 [Fusibacter sp. 3D3]